MGFNSGFKGLMPEDGQNMTEKCCIYWSI